MQAVTKITTAKVIGKISGALKAELEREHALATLEQRSPTPIPLYRVSGVVTGNKKGQHDFGPWVALRGDFTAVRRDTGEVFQSSNAIIPGPSNDILGKAIEAEGAVALEFACDIGVIFNAKNALGYEYVTMHLIELDTSSSPSAKLLARVHERFPLPAPSKAPVALLAAKPADNVTTLHAPSAPHGVSEQAPEKAPSRAAKAPATAARGKVPAPAKKAAGGRR